MFENNNYPSSLEDMKEILLQAKEVLQCLNDIYHLDTFYESNSLLLKSNVLPAEFGCYCIDLACNWINDFIDVREDNKDKK